MAKKKTDTDTPAAEVAPAADAKPEKTEKAKAPKAEKAAAKANAKTETPATDGASQESVPQIQTAETAPADIAEPTKKRGRPGVPPRRGKKLRTKMSAIANDLAKLGTVDVKKAVNFLKSHKRVKFDESVEVHMSLGIDPKQSDQVVRGAVPLPHGLGRSKKVAVFTKGDNATKAKEAGADYVGDDDLAKRITSEGFTDFDVALATPDMMGVVGRLGKVLGPRGLMPSPKAGTVVTGDIAAAVKEFKAGKVEFRADAGGNVHAAVGKLSFDDSKLVDNIQAFVE
ncbi:MAG TPA: 50S ribosomal protein L1, partial [Gemmatales bacterium]|nr:50S ribosomal protein L1 [Gemmatales bacterium]